jgi:zinc transporter ZupT
METEMTSPRAKLPLWISALIPILALALMLSIFAFGDPLALFKANLPPIEQLTFERVRVVADGFDVTVINSGPDPVTVAQVQVDGAYWQYSITPRATLPRLGQAEIAISYPWVAAEPNVIRVITDSGLTFEQTVGLAIPTPTPGLQEFFAYGLLGVYVGIIPVGLGMLWFPAMRRMGEHWLGTILALTLGLLVFLLIDTLLEAFEVASALPAVFQGISLVLFAALLTWFALLAVRSKGGAPPRLTASHPGLPLAGLLALGIGLHNLGEGLAIGAAFSLGEAALGSFLVIGFTMHNVTEGVGIAAPLLPDRSRPEADRARSPKIWTFLALMLVAGAPAIIGAWIGGFAFSPILTALFLGVGVGAIWQVIVEVGSFLRRHAEREGEHLVSWGNVGGFLAGLMIMYLTAFLVSF